MSVDLVYNVENVEVLDLLTIASDKGLYWETFEGVLNDHYVIFDVENMTYDGASRSFWLFEAKATTTWTYRYELTMTDDESVSDAFCAKVKSED